TTGTTRCCRRCTSKRSAGRCDRWNELRAASPSPGSPEGLRYRCLQRASVCTSIALLFTVLWSGASAVQQPPAGRGGGRGAGRGAAVRQRKAVLAWADTRNGIAQQKGDLLGFVRDDGKGFVAAHTATTAFESWPEFGELIGARYDGHPWNTASGTVINEDPSFPATQHLPATFAFTDEFYQPKDY